MPLDILKDTLVIGPGYHTKYKLPMQMFAFFHLRYHPSDSEDIRSPSPSERAGVRPNRQRIKTPLVAPAHIVLAIQGTECIVYSIVQYSGMCLSREGAENNIDRLVRL